MLGKLMAFVATSDAARSLAFYRDVLGLALVADEAHALVFVVGGTMLRVQKAQAVTPAPYTALGWQVDDVRGAIAGLRERGVRFERFELFAQDGDGVWTAPDGTKIAWFRDPDGNLLSLTQFA